MKKIISVISVILISVFCLGLTAISVPETKGKIATISEDLQVIQSGKEKFYRINSNDIEFDYIVVDDEEYVYDENTIVYEDKVVVEYADEMYEFQLSENQKKTIENIEDCSLGSEVYIDIVIYYKDGTSLSGLKFLNEKYLDEYNDLIENGSDTYLVDFIFPDNNFVNIPKAALFNSDNKTTIKTDDFFDECYVYIENSSKIFRIEQGSIITYKDEFYYRDNKENGLKSEFVDGVHNTIYHEKSTVHNTIYHEKSTVSVYKITDENTINKLKEAQEKYYEDDFGFLFNEKLAESISKVLFVVIFGILPLAVLVLSIVICVRSSKKAYKKICITTSVLSVTEIISFIIAIVLLFKK